MFTSTHTYSAAGTDTRFMLRASVVRPWNQDRLHTGITLAGRSLR